MKKEKADSFRAQFARVGEVVLEPSDDGFMYKILYRGVEKKQATGIFWQDPENKKQKYYMRLQKHKFIGEILRGFKEEDSYGVIPTDEPGYVFMTDGKHKIADFLPGGPRDYRKLVNKGGIRYD